MGCEAIHRDVPVFAFDAAAVPYSTGEGVLLFADKDPALVAETIAAVLDDEATREALLTRQRRALGAVDPQTVLTALMDHLQGLSEST